MPIRNSHEITDEALLQRDTFLRVKPDRDDPILIGLLSARIPGCGANLLSYYAGLVRTTGTGTTSNDTFRALLSWLTLQGAYWSTVMAPRVENTGAYGSDWEKWAAGVIREVAQHYKPAGVVA